MDFLLIFFVSISSGYEHKFLLWGVFALISFYMELKTSKDDGQGEDFWQG